MKTTYEHFVFEVKTRFEVTIITCLVRSHIRYVHHNIDNNQVLIGIGNGEDILFDKNDNFAEKFLEWWRMKQ
jgi:hypothetical protein